MYAVFSGLEVAQCQLTLLELHYLEESGERQWKCFLIQEKGISFYMFPCALEIMFYLNPSKGCSVVHWFDAASE